MNKDTSYNKLIATLGNWPSAQSYMHTLLDISNFEAMPRAGMEAICVEPIALDDLGLAIATLQASIQLIDDLLDDEDDGYFHKVGVGDCANISAALQALGIELLERIQTDPLSKLRAIIAYNTTALSTARGQQLDTTADIATEAEYWHVASNKSGPFYSLKLRLGALIAGANDEECRDLDYLGSIFGEVVQVHDDIQDCLQPTITADWERSAISLPILYAEQVNHPGRERFLELRQGGIDSAEKLREAQTILFNSGAISYCYLQLLERYRYATIYARNSTLANPDAIEALFRRSVEPLVNLLGSQGILISLEELTQQDSSQPAFQPAI